MQLIQKLRAADQKGPPKKFSFIICFLTILFLKACKAPLYLIPEGPECLRYAIVCIPLHLLLFESRPDYSLLQQGTFWAYFIGSCFFIIKCYLVFQARSWGSLTNVNTVKV